MIVTVGGIKGGVGKSLISTNLVVLRSQIKNKKILFVDGDEQGTSNDWVEHRNGLGIPVTWDTKRLIGSEIRTNLLELKTGYNDVIIDCGGRDTESLRAALTISDKFIVPFQPKSFDIWTMNQVSQLVEEAKKVNPNLKAYSFINCGGHTGKDNEDALQILKQFSSINVMPVIIGLRKAFSNATAEGLGITELKPLDKKACTEIETLYRHVFGTKIV